MHRLKWLFVALVSLSAGPGLANRIVSQTLGVQPLEGCKVEVTVRLLQGMRASFDVVRARREFAFENRQCTQQLRTLSQPSTPTPPAPSKSPPPSKGSPLLLTEEREYDTFTFVDEVCAEGTWIYKLLAKSTNDPWGQSYRDARTETVEVKGCARKACSAQLEAPARNVESPPQKPLCDVLASKDDLKEGDEQIVSGHRLGAILKGSDVIEVTKAGKQFVVAGMAPGMAWVALGRPAKPGSCMRFTVPPNPSQDLSLSVKKRWAYREFVTGRVVEDTLVSVKRDARWPLPIPGSVLLPPLSRSSLGVNETCAPILHVRGEGRPDYMGVMVTDAQGGEHLYFLTYEAQALGTP